MSAGFHGDAAIKSIADPNTPLRHIHPSIHPSNPPRCNNCRLSKRLTSSFIGRPDLHWSYRRSLQSCARQKSLIKLALWPIKWGGQLESKLRPAELIVPVINRHAEWGKRRPCWALCHQACGDLIRLNSKKLAGGVMGARLSRTQSRAIFP